MRLLTLPLCALALATVAATCVSGLRRLDDAGPWTGEITNVGDATVSEVSVDAAVTDADGSALRHASATCPSVLLPGERAAFEVRAHPDERLGGYVPFDARVSAVNTADGAGESYSLGLFAREVSRDAVERTVRVEIRNNGDAGYTDPSLCAVGVALDGSVRAASAVAQLFPDDPLAGKPVLAPGESVVVDVPFPGGLPDVVRLYPSGHVEGEPPPCCVPPTGAGGWSRADTGPFGVLLPPGWRYEPLQGIDSLVGRFTGDGVSLTFDYGWYSAGLADEGDPQYRVHLESVGGREAKIVVAGPGGEYAGVFFPATVATERFAQTPTRLNIVSDRALSPEQTQLALQIFRSVRFDAW